jgi:hypothetical protein
MATPHRLRHHAGAFGESFGSRVRIGIAGGDALLRRDGGLSMRPLVSQRIPNAESR